MVKWWKTQIDRGKGQIKVSPLLVALVVISVVLAVVPILSATSVSQARSTLESQGYVVLTATEYNTLNTKLDALKVSADAAVVNAQNAVIAAQAAVVSAESSADKVDLFNSASVYLFPSTTANYVLMASGDNNTFGAWAELKDNLNVTLSSKFAANDGYIGDFYLYDLTAPATLHLIEMNYILGVDNVTVARVMFNTDYMHLAQIKSRHIPAGATIYYRMMCNAIPTQYVSIGLRYFFE